MAESEDKNKKTVVPPTKDTPSTDADTDDAESMRFSPEEEAVCSRLTNKLTPAPAN